jgi:hypothetical protein
LLHFDNNWLNIVFLELWYAINKLVLSSEKRAPYYFPLSETDVSTNFVLCFYLFMYPEWLRLLMPLDCPFLSTIWLYCFQNFDLTFYWDACVFVFKLEILPVFLRISVESGDKHHNPNLYSFSIFYREVICALVQHLSHFMHFCVDTKKNPTFWLLESMLIMRKTKIKYPWTSLTISKIRIFAMVFSIFHFLKEGGMTRGERESGRNDPGRTLTCFLDVFNIIYTLVLLLSIGIQILEIPTCICQKNSHVS